MSAIASFYLILNEDVPVLKELASEPVGPMKRRFLFFTYSTGHWRDPFHEFLVTKAKELEVYGWSGYVVGVEIDLYLRSLSVEMEVFSDAELSKYFSNARNGSLLVFRRDGAGKLIEAIVAKWPTVEILTAFLNSEEMKSTTEEEPVPVQAMMDGLEILKRWLSQVDESHIGLLSIG